MAHHPDLKLARFDSTVFWKAVRLITALSLVVQAVTGSVPVSAMQPGAAPEPPKLEDFVLLGQESVWVEKHARVYGGDIGANALSQGGQATLTLEKNSRVLTPDSALRADSLALKSNVRVYDVYFNQLTNGGRILGQQHTPLSLPLVAALPPVPAFTAGTQGVKVKHGDSLTLSPGSYAKLEVLSNATLTFSGGVYTFSSWDIGQNARLYAAAPTEIRVAGRIDLAHHVRLQPAPGAAGVDAADILLYVTGQNGSSGTQSAQPPAAKVGRGSRLTASVYVPNGTLLVERNSRMTGGFIARWIRVRQNARLYLQSGWNDPLPPPAPTAGFTAQPLSGPAPLTVSFTNTTAGEVTGYTWEFGDGTLSNDAHPAHVYLEAGVYTVRLTAVGPGGAHTFTREAYIDVLAGSTPPVVSIASPPEGAVVRAGPLEVTGTVADDGPGVQVWVNDVPAVVSGETFSAVIPLVDGNQLIEAVARDAQDLSGGASRIVRVDGQGPMVGIESPAEGQAVYTRSPEARVTYSDFYSQVAVGTFSAMLSDAAGSQVDVTGSFAPGAAAATGTLAGLADDHTYTLTVSVADSLGNVGTRASTFYVPPDPTAVTPPETAEGTGWVSGRVYDSATCNEHLTTCAGLAGVQVTLAPIDHETRETAPDVPGVVVSGPDGFYAFPVDDTGVYALRLEKPGYTYSQRELAVVRGRSTAVNAAYLTPLDPAVTDCDHLGCQHVSADGQLRVDIPPGAIAQGETVRVTATDFEQVEFLPGGALPPGTGETYAFNLGGESEAQFLRPVTVSIRNDRGFEPGTQIPLGYWNQVTLQWEHVNVGVVDASGEWVTMVVEHFSNYDCNFLMFGPQFSVNMGNGTQPDSPCSDGEGGCFINVKSGAVREWIELPPVDVLGEPVAPTLAYNTSRANPSEVIDLQLNLSVGENVTFGDHVQFELYIEGQKTDQFTFEADLAASGEVGRYRYLWDGRNMLGERLPPGIYEYAVKLSVPYTGRYCAARLNRFGVPVCVPNVTVDTVEATREIWTHGTIELNTQAGGPYGQGWVLADQQFVVADEAGRLLVAEGDRLDEYYFQAADQLGGLRQNRLDREEPPVIGPAAEVTIVPQPADGGTPVSGRIDVDTTWTQAGSPYVVTGGDLVVGDGAALTLEPGVMVMLDQYQSLIVEGELQAVGTALDPITFTAYTDGTFENWDHYAVFDPAQGEYVRLVDAVAVDSHNNAWFAGTNSGYMSALRVDRLRADRATWDSFPLPSGLGAFIVHDIAADPLGRVWFATDGGAAMLSADGLTWTLYQQSETVPLTSNHVYTAAVAPDGAIWFGTDSGANRYDPDSGSWQSYWAGGELPGAPVYAIALGQANEVWLGTGAGLCRLIVDGGGNAGCTVQNSESVTDLALDQQGNPWAVFVSGGSGQGIGMLSPETGEWTRYTAGPDGLVSSSVTSIAVDDQNRKWIGYSSQGVSILSSDNAFWFHETAPRLSRDTVTDIALAPDGAVWVGTYNNDTPGSSTPAPNVTRIFRGTYHGGAFHDGYWGTLQIGGGANPGDSDDSRLSHVRIEGAGIGGLQSLYLFQSAPTLDNLAIQGSGGHGLVARNSPGFTLDTATLDGSEGDGLLIQGGSGAHTLTTVIARSNNGHGLHLAADFSGTATVEAAVLAYNQGYGLFADSAEARLVLQDSLIESNGDAARLPADTQLHDNTWAANRRQQIEWTGGTLTSDLTWDVSAGPQIVLGEIVVAEGAALTLPAGTTALFAGSGLVVEGRLSAVGTADAPVYAGPQEGHLIWSGLFLSASDESRLSYVTIERAAQGLSLHQSRPTLDHLTFANNQISLNASESGGAAIHDSNFMGSRQYAIRNQTPEQGIDAAGNYWGGPGGPNHPQLNPTGDGGRVSDGVDITPWLKMAVPMAGLEFDLVKRTLTDRTVLDYDEATGAYVRYEPDGTQIQFDAQGRHQSTLEPGGRATHYAYNPDGSLASLGIAAPGETTPRWVWTFAYQDGRLHTITDPADRETTFTVDSNGQLTQARFPDGSERRFYYDPRGLLTQQVDPAGGVTHYVYDDYGRLRQHIAPARDIVDPATGQSAVGQEVMTFTPSDTGYTLINAMPSGDPDAPAPAVPRSSDLIDRVDYGQGSVSGRTNAWGHWTERTDALNRTTHITRDFANRITRVTLPDGACIEADYDEAGNVTQAVRMDAGQCALPPHLRDPEQQQATRRTLEPRFNQTKTVTDTEGNTLTYVYDYEAGVGEAGRVIRVEYPAVPDESGQPVTPQAHYTYDALGSLETETDVRGTVTRYIYTQGTPDEAAGGGSPLFAPGVTPVPGLITRIIDDDGGLNSTTTFKDFDASGNAQTVIYPGGERIHTYTFDTAGRVLTETNAFGIVTTYDYDSRGQLIHQVVDYTPDGVTGENVVTTYAYDADGRLVHQRTAADGLVAEKFSAYDLHGRLVAERDGQGNETRSLYDEAGQLIETIDAAGGSTRYTYTTAGLPETVRDPGGHLTRTVYDTFGRPRQVIQAEGELDLTTTYTYNPDSTVARMESPDGVVTCFDYDSLRRRTQTIQDCGPGGLSLTTTYAYDLAGNVVFTTDSRGTVTFTGYDALGRASLTRQDDGGLDLETHTLYDAAGNVAGVVGPDGATSALTYDPMNRLVRSCQDSLGLNLCTTYTYDRLGNAETVTDAEGVVQRTTYNAFGLPVQKVNDAGGLAASIAFEYDSLLRLIRVIDANGNATRYAYDALGRVATETHADGTTAGFTYDARGSLLARTLEDGASITYTYDALGRRQRADFSTGGFQSFVYDDASRLTESTQVMGGHTTVLGYDYNAVGEVTHTTQQLDSGPAWQVQYAYDYLEGTRTVTYPSGAVRTYRFDALNRLGAVESGEGALIASYGYDQVNRFNTLAYANGLTTRTDYDALGRITRVSSPVADYRYRYDAVGNRTSMQRAHRPGQPFDVYEYDGLYQLVDAWYGADSADPDSITLSASQQSYDLDRQGNRLALTEDDLVETYAPNDGAQLTNSMNRYESVDGAGLTYDLRGNTLADGANTYTYDLLNRQTSVVNALGATEYLYDARGRRVAKVTGGVAARQFVYDTEYRVIEERDQAGALIARYTYGQGMDEPLTLERGGQTYFYHRDALGSITEITNGSGALVERYEYDVYGAASIFSASGALLSASAIGNRYLFTGRELDSESGSYYYRARYYSPELGRFLSQDPLGFEAGDYNLYRYVFNNPANLTDPTGEFAFLAWLGKATLEAAIDALMQAVVYYFFDPEVSTAQQAIDKINWGKVGWAFISGLLPGGAIAQALFEASGEVLFNWLEMATNCETYTAEQAIIDFALAFVLELLGDSIGEFVVKYGKVAVAKGLRRLGMYELALTVLGVPAKLDIPGGAHRWVWTPKTIVTKHDTTMYRVWGGGTDRQGPWVTTVRPRSGSEARAGLALPPENLATFYSEVKVPAGTEITIGYAAALYGQPGGWFQVALPGDLDSILRIEFGPGIPLPP